MRNSIKFNVRPHMPAIENAGVRTSVFLKSHGLPNSTIHSQVLILEELIRNGIKYGKFSPTNNEIAVVIYIADKTLSIEVMNPVDETCHDELQELDKTIRFIRGYQDPSEAYMVKRKAVAQNSLGGGKNGLGLAKIACEGGAILDFFVNETNILNMTAVKNLDFNHKS